MRQIGLLLGWIVLVTLVGMGCNGPVPTPTTLVPTPSPSGKITFAVSGGFPGVQRVLEVDPNGQASLTDRDQPIGTIQLSQERLAELQMEFTTADFLSLRDYY